MGNGAMGGSAPPVKSVVTSPFQGMEPPSTGDIIAYLNDVFIERHNEVALIDAWTEEKLLYGTLWEQVKNASSNLLQHNFTSTSCLAVCCPNCLELIPVILAVWRIGGHVCFVNHLESVDAIHKAFLMSNATLVIGHVDILYKIADAWAGTNIQRCIVRGDFVYRMDSDVSVIMRHGEEYNNCIDVDDLFAKPKEIGIHTTRDIVLRQKGSDCIHKVAVILYTGGVSGDPKPVEITVRGLVYAAFCFSHSAFHRPSKYHILYDVLANVFGLGVLLGTLKSGTTCILMKRYDLDKFFHTVVKYKVETLHLFPAIGLLFSQQALDIKGSMHFIREVIYYTQGSPLAVRVEEQIRKKIKANIHVRQVYGMTETTGPVCMVPSKHVKRPTEPGSCGFVLPGWEVIIVSMISGELSKVGDRGEVCIKGPFLMKGYRGDRKANTLATFDSNGWLHTGDYGYCTSEGEIHILCRLEDVVKYQGIEVIPTELESMLLSSPCVWKAGVIGFPDRNANEVPMAWVVKNPDTVGSDVEIELWVGERVADHKQLRGGVKLVNEIPQSMTGQILRKQIKKEELRSRMVVKSSKKLVRSETVKVLEIDDKDKLPKDTAKEAKG